MKGLALFIILFPLILLAVNPAELNNPAPVAAENPEPQRTIITWDCNNGLFRDWDVTVNWDLNRLPNATDDVVIPSGLTYYPIIPGDYNAVCHSVTMAGSTALYLNGTLTTGTFVSVGSVATLSIAGTLTTGTYLRTYGNITFTDEEADFTIGTGLDFMSGSSVVYNAGLLSYPDIDVNGNLIFYSGSAIALTQGRILLSGTGTQAIVAYANTTLNALVVQGSDCEIPNYATHNLTFNSTVTLNYGSYVNSYYAGNTYFKGNLTTAATNSCFYFHFGTAILQGTVNSYVKLGATGYFNHLSIAKATANHVTLDSHLFVYGNLGIASGLYGPTVTVSTSMATGLIL